MSAPNVRLTPLGGLGQVGGSTWHIAQGRSGGLLLDFGTDLQATSKRLANGARTRDSRGIDDALRLQLIPQIDGIYREDAIADPEILEDAEELSPTDLLGSHKHEDHLGQLHALHPSIRLHCSRAAAGSLHSAHIVNSGLKSETTHYVERQPHPTERGLLEKPRGAEPQSRPILLVDGEPTEAMRAMWRDAGCDEGLERSDMVAGGIPFRAHKVCHSVFGSVAYTLKTEQGDVVHAGDLRLHGSMGDRTRAFIQHMEENRPRLLMLEGTRLGRENEPLVTEAQCARRIRDLVNGAGRRLVVGCVGPNHLERLAAFLGAAQDSRRRLVVSPRTMVLLESVGAADPYYDMAGQPGLAVFDPPMLARPTWHQELRERRGRQLVSPEEVAKDPHRYVLSHTSLRSKDLLDVRPEGALMVYSSSAAYSSEARHEHAALGLWCQMFSIETEGISFENGVVYDPRLNPSGHLSHEDIKDLLQKVKPHVLVPVHCANPELFKEIAPKGTSVRIPEVGRTIRLA